MLLIAGYADMACSVDYITSHDVADGPRLMNIILGPMLQAAGLGDGGVQNVRSAVDTADTSSNPTLKAWWRQPCAGSSGRSPF